jgi:hypothetical protein
MSTNLTNPTPDPAANPYAPPVARIEEVPDVSGDLAEMEAIRRKHINHEASVKSVGSLHFLAAFFTLLGAFAVLFMLVTDSPSLAGASRAPALLGSVIYLFFGAVHIGLGIGLNKLQTWARWVECVLTGLSLLIVTAGAVTMLAMGIPALAVAYGVMDLILAYILYLLVSAKGSVVFSSEYKNVIARTPHVKYRSGCLWVVLIVVIVALVVIVGGALFSVSRPG